MKKIFLFILLTACMTKNPLKDLRFEVINVDQISVAIWYRVTNSQKPLMLYVNTDQYLIRKDKSENVLYIDKPCQIIKSSLCPITIEQEKDLILKIISEFQKRFEIQKTVQK